MSRGPVGQGPRVVAMGGGHGLSASLRALRRLTDNLTAVVGVADDGGSSGRLRAEFGIPAPGDLRMALAALCDDDPVGRAWGNLLQHRYGGSGPLAGHAVGNLLLTALWEATGDVVAGLDYLSALVEARGRVLPASTVPMEVVAEVELADGSGVVPIRGQADVARSGGRVVKFELLPGDAAGCTEAVAALEEADMVVLGPGSWFTSVLPHLEITDIRRALGASPALRVLVLNLQSQTAETVGYQPEDHLLDLAARHPDVRIEVVLADDRAVPDQDALIAAAEQIGATVRFERLAAPAFANALPRSAHNPDLLAAAFGPILERGRIGPWR